MNRLYVIGIGPGKRAGMTLEADEALCWNDIRLCWDIGSF